jgi:hypothetical protein
MCIYTTVVGKRNLQMGHKFIYWVTFHACRLGSPECGRFEKLTHSETFPVISAKANKFECGPVTKQKGYYASLLSLIFCRYSTKFTKEWIPLCGNKVVNFLTNKTNSFTKWSQKICAMILFSYTFHVLCDYILVHSKRLNKTTWRNK